MSIQVRIQKNKLIPSKVDTEKQRVSVVQYQELNINKAPEDLNYFMDAIHLHLYPKKNKRSKGYHNPMAGFGWSRRYQNYKAPSNIDRQYISINGAIGIANLQSSVCYNNPINMQSTLLLFQQIEEQAFKAGRIYIICNNVRYCCLKLVQDYQLNSKIDLSFPLSYTASLNLIECYGSFQQKTLYG